jgi:hypothetical protein
METGARILVVDDNDAGRNTDMANRGEGIRDVKQSAGSRAEFIRLAGIGPELAAFLTEFVEKPDKFYSMPFERRREIENQMDSIIASFGKW